MIKALIIVLILATTACGQTRDPMLPEDVILTNGIAFIKCPITSDCEISGEEYAIKYLAESGKICEVYDHWWLDDEFEWDCPHPAQGACLDILPTKSVRRHCKICKLKKKWSEKWED